MLKGDLSTTSLPEVLAELADGAASGCLHVDDGTDEARVYLRGGLVYSVQVPGPRPLLGARLVSSGALGPEALAEAYEAQRTELQGWRLGELLVHLGYVDPPVVEAFVTEQVRESTADLLLWDRATWRFRVNERTREDVAPPTPVADLLAEVSRRRKAWESLVEVIHGADATPMLAAGQDASAEMEIAADAWSLLCKVDGVRTIAELARDCGFTHYEAGQVVFALANAGLVEVAEPVETFEEFAEAVASARPADTASVASRLVDAFRGAAPKQPEEPSPADVAAMITSALRPPAPRQHVESHALWGAPDEPHVEGSIDKVSQALAALLGPAPSGEDAFAAPSGRGRAEPGALSGAERQAQELLDARREHDAAELAFAQAELEAAKAAHVDAAAAEDEVPDDTGAEIVNLEQRRGTARREQAAAERVAAEQAEAERIAAEQAEAERAEAERVAAEQAAAERVAAEQAEAERIAAEQAEAERIAAEQAEAERVAAEQAEAERVAAELAEAERAEAERVAAEHAEAQRAEVERVAADQAENARVEAERAETERVEVERVAAEQAEKARVEAERAEAERVEAQRPAAEALSEKPPAPPVDDFFGSATTGDTAAVFAELSATAQSSTAPSAPPPAPPVEEEETVAEEPPSFADRDSDTDTASLLRELAFLGHDEEPTPPPTTRPPAHPSRPPAAAAAAKKKKGLFGR